MSYLIETREIGDYRIKVFQDDDAECPCTAWDLTGLYFWNYSDWGYNRELSNACNCKDVGYCAEDVLKWLVCKYVSQKKVVDYINNPLILSNYRLRYDKSDHMWYLENLYQNNWYEHSRFSPYEMKNGCCIDELCDILEEGDFASLLQDCKKIAFYEWSSSGCCQGDYVSGYAYCDKERFKRNVDTDTKNWRKRAMDLFDGEVKDIGMWMWGDVKGFVLEKKVLYKKVFTEIDRESEDSYDWEEVDSCYGYYMDTDELIDEVLSENGIKKNDAA